MNKLNSYLYIGIHWIGKIYDFRTQIYFNYKNNQINALNIFKILKYWLRNRI